MDVVTKADPQPVTRYLRFDVGQQVAFSLDAHLGSGSLHKLYAQVAAEGQLVEVGYGAVLFGHFPVTDYAVAVVVAVSGLGGSGECQTEANQDHQVFHLRLLFFRDDSSCQGLHVQG